MDFLKLKRRPAPPHFLVVSGDEPFLARQAHLTVREWIVGPDPDDFTYSVVAGPSAAWRDVGDELCTPPMLGDRRLVVVSAADTFVTEHRDLLLRLALSPSSFGYLLLEVRTWRSNTKLAAQVEASGLWIEAEAPKDWLVPGWCEKWCALRYGKRLDTPTAQWLVELVGPRLGVLDQELAKLAGFVGDSASIEMDAVRQLVAGTRVESAFKLLDMVFEGKIGTMLDYLDRQLVSGESPVGILAMLNSQLRRLAQASRGVGAGQSAKAALESAGVPHFAIAKAEAQMRRLGPVRLADLYRRLLRADLDLKGGGGMSERLVLERFLLELSLPPTAAGAGAR